MSGRGISTPFAHREFNPVKGPSPREILQRIPRTAPLGQRIEALLLLFAHRALRILFEMPLSGGHPQQGIRLPRRVLDVGLPQRIADGEIGLLHYHRSSSPSLGRTALTEAIATSIILSSGSAVVSRCSQSPGAEMIRVSRLSCRPANLMTS